MSRMPTLPADFAAQLLDLELELETHCVPVTIVALIGLYQQAIVYFEHFKTEDYKTYQIRLQKMLMRSDVQAAMANPSQESTSPTTIKEKREFFQKQESKFSITPTTIPSDTIKVHDLGSTAAASKAAMDVVSMKSALDVRLSIRKRTGKTWTAMTPRVKRTAFVFDDVAEAVSTIDELSIVQEENIQVSEKEIITFGKCLEEVMEKHFAEKASKIAEIRLKYQLQIQELEEDANPFIGQVVEQMKVSMANEIANVTAELDKKRKSAIEEVKAQYFVS